MKQQTKKLFFFFLMLSALQAIYAQQYEAENADYSGTNTTENITGASGSCIRLESQNDYIRIAVNISEAGTYKVYVAYASPYGNKNGNISINGIPKIVTFSEGSNCSEMFIGNYNLFEGNNTIEITPDWTWFYIDYIRIEAVNGDNSDENNTPNGKGFVVSGTKLLDVNGNEFIMRGVNVAWAWYQSSGMSQLEAIARAGANTVRIVLSDGKKWDKTSASTVASLISKCEQLNMIAVLEVHDYTGSNNQNDLISAANYFLEIKNVLIGKESTVILNIANEWLGQWNSTNWENGYKLVIPTIRNAGLSHCLMIDAGGWGQHAASVHEKGTNVLNTDPDRNIIFSIHMYEVAGSSNVVKNNINGVINQNLALCIGEFGWYHGDSDVDEDLIMSYCNEKNVGWLAWSWYGNGGGVEYLDLVKSPGNENTVYTASTNGKTCNWGQKIIQAWKNEAVTCTVYTDFSSHDNVVSRNTRAYPTQITNVLNVISSESSRIIVTNMDGKRIYATIADEEHTIIPCMDWHTGIYLLTIIQNNEIETYKIIK